MASVGRLTVFGKLLLLGVVTTVVLAIVAPAAGLIAAVVLAVCALAALADGMTDAAGWFDIDVAAERKRDALSRRLRVGRPRWERTPPDHADESPDAIWARERRRRGLR